MSISEFFNFLIYPVDTELLDMIIVLESMARDLESLVLKPDNKNRN